MLDVLLPLWPFAIYFTWLLCGPHSRKQCPDCGASLSGWQNPFTKSRRQWAEGGFRCQQCGCEMDIQGRKVVAGTPPRPGAVRRGLLMIALTGIPAVILLLVIRWQSAPIMAPVAPPPVLAPVPPG